MKKWEQLQLTLSITQNPKREKAIIRIKHKIFSCLISFPSVHISLFMFDLISFSPQYIPFISSTIVHLTDI